MTAAAAVDISLCAGSEQAVDARGVRGRQCVARSTHVRVDTAFVLCVQLWHIHPTDMEHSFVASDLNPLATREWPLASRKCSDPAWL